MKDMLFDTVPFEAHCEAESKVRKVNPDNEGPAVLKRKLRTAWRFTRTHREHRDAPAAIREAHCLAAQYPACCRPIRDYDLLAGRLYYVPMAGFVLENVVNSDIPALCKDRCPEDELSGEERWLRRNVATSHGGYSFDYSTLKKLADRTPPGGEREAIRDLIDYWLGEATTHKYMRALPPDVKAGFGRVTNECQYASHFFRSCCLSLDYDKLMRLGLPGMRDLIRAKHGEAVRNGGRTDLYEGMLLGLDVAVAVARHYREEVAALAARTDDPVRRGDLMQMERALVRIQTCKPSTLREAMQLFWIYNMIADTVNFGRMDVYFGDFYARDLDEGVETEASALRLILSLWTIISEQAADGFGSYRFNARIVVGGKGRRNEANADRFALAALEATRLLKRTEPTTTLRFYEGQNPALMDKALECIKEGCVHPTLYKDERHIAMVREAYDVTPEEAEGYLPQGCGEITVDHISIGSPNNIINYVTGLDLVLHNGHSTETREQRGLALGGLDEFDTFDKLVAAFKTQIDHTNGLFARRHALEHKIAAENAAHLFLSMLTDDCIERNRGVFEGGTRYLGGTIETFGMTNVCDALIAIKKLVYDERKLTLRQVVGACDANFEGCEDIRRLLLAAPKYGNDLAEIDDFHTAMSAWLCANAASKAKPNGLHYLLNCNLNPDGIRYALNTKASADGRRYGEAFAVGCAPTAGRDKNGITAVLNSMAKHDELHSGYVHNLKVAKSMFAPESIGRFRALLGAYFRKGWQLMVTAIDPDDLKNAMERPEHYAHVLVRVGGWTARFIDLPRPHQIEILHRTLYA